jgi:hypothetical protein
VKAIRLVVGLIVALLAVVLAGCAAFPVLGGPGAGRYPDACAAWEFPERQCKAIAAAAVDQVNAKPDEVAEIWLVPFDLPQEANLGGRQIARVVVKLVSGREVTHDVWCGISFSPVCDPNARLMQSSGVDHDVPCDGEPPGGCATLPPTPPPDVVERAEPLTVEALDIPIGKEGHYRVEVGRATLPNGYLSERSMTIVDPQPTGFWADFIQLEVRPDDPGRPPVGSIYRELFDGAEPVTVYIVFDVTAFEKPSTLQLRDIVVR